MQKRVLTSPPGQAGKIKEENAYRGCAEVQLPGLYLHIPFCAVKCRYCNFFSVTKIPEIPRFLQALFKEALLQRGVFDSFDTLYIGGGTPSLLSPFQLSELISHLRKTYDIFEDAEVTMEVNPADVGLPVLEHMRALGINRLNIGVQSFDDTLLSFLGRRHDGSQAIQSIMAARQAGFDHIGIDLIYGIPGQTRQAWKKALEYAASLNIPHLSCYQLTLESDTPLGKSCAQGLFKIPDDDELFGFFMDTSEFLESSGYTHYEVSNFALGKSFVSRHNSKYWRHIPYLGLGPAAHSFDGGKRWENVRSLECYFQRLERGERPVESCEVLTNEELQMETLFLGFRTRAGIDLGAFSERFGVDLWASKKDFLKPLLSAGHLRIANGRLQPTRTGMALADALALL